MSALDAWIASQLAGANTQQISPNLSAPAATNNATWDSYLALRPDVMAEFKRLSPNNLRNNYGITTPQEFAKWHYSNKGIGEGMVLGSDGRFTDATKSAVTPTTPNTTPNTTPTTPVTPTTPTSPTTATPPVQDPTGGNTSTTPYVPVTKTAAQARAEAIARQIALAKQEAIGRGLDYGMYGSTIESTINDLFAGIPQDVADYSGFISPTFAGSIFSGMEAQNRANFGSQVSSNFSVDRDRALIPTSLLDATINDLLGTNYSTAKEGLTRAQKRGQLNEIGYSAGNKKLDTQKLGVQSKLNSTGRDVLQKYWDQLDEIENSASQAASGYRLGDNFNLNGYLDRAKGVGADAQTYAPGDFLNLVGDDPLFDLSGLLGTAGQAQGAINLQNLDLLDAIQKKKQADTQGRGLGSQGAF